MKPYRQWCVSAVRCVCEALPSVVCIGCEVSVKPYRQWCVSAVRCVCEALPSVVCIGCEVCL